MAYVSGFLCAVPTARKQDYLDFATRSWPLFESSGALDMWECWGEDVPDGEVTSFPMAVKKTDDETVVFSWIVWPDKATADAAYATMESDPKWKEMGEMPMDGKRMIWGNFTPIGRFSAKAKAA